MSNIDIEAIRQGILATRRDNRVHVFKGLVPITPTWDKFIKHFDDAIHTFPPSQPQQPLEERIINGVIQRGLFYFMVDGPSQEHYPESQVVHDIFNEALNAEISPASAFINFIGKEKPGGAHIDNRETIYWQCIGKSIWRLFHSLGDQYPYEEHVLEPGDVLYAPEGIIHQVKAEEPRAAMGFQYRLNDQLFMQQAN